MAIALSILVEGADRYLGAARIQDYYPNGLRVEGRPQVRRIVSGVTASQVLLDIVVKANADVVLIHYGCFWKGENPYMVGVKQRRLRTLLNNDISLLAYHLPLGLHPEVGNNVQLARRLGFEVEGPLEPGNPRSIVFLDSLTKPMRPADLARRMRDALGRRPLLVDADQLIRRIVQCTGGVQGCIDQAIAAGVDAYLTDEVSEQTVHSTRENGISFIAAGRRATGHYGVQALGDYLGKHFAIEHLFIGCPNPAQRRSGNAPDRPPCPVPRQPSRNGCCGCSR